MKRAIWEKASDIDAINMANCSEAEIPEGDLWQLKNK